ncbi:MAG: four helix bundle protein [Aeromonas sp.]
MEHKACGVNLVRKYIELAAQLNIYLNHWPQHEKYGLAQQVRNKLYECYALMVEAHKRYHKRTSLTQLDIAHEQLRMLLYLGSELGYFGHHKGRAAPDTTQANLRRWLVLSARIDEIGRMLGGWIKKEAEIIKK